MFDNLYNIFKLMVTLFLQIVKKQDFVNIFMTFHISKQSYRFDIDFIEKCECNLEVRGNNEK